MLFPYRPSLGSLRSVALVEGERSLAALLLLLFVLSPSPFPSRCPHHSPSSGKLVRSAADSVWAAIGTSLAIIANDAGVLLFAPMEFSRKAPGKSPFLSRVIVHEQLTFRYRSRSTIIVELQETIAELRSWNYLLEDALRTLQASITSEPHPLLRDRTPDRTPEQNNERPSSASASQDEEVLDALGNFSIFGDDGQISLHGPTAATEYLVRENPRLLPNLIQQERTESPMSLPADVILLSALFPFPPEPLPIEKLDDLAPHLPPYKTMLSMSELYFQHFTWCANPIPRHVFASTVIQACYPRGEPAASLRRVSSHVVAILFMACGLGLLADIQNPRRFVAAEELHTLARAALCIQPVYENPTIYAAQAMCVMLLYHMCTERRSNGYTLALWSVTGRLCEALGLNYDQKKLLKRGCVEMREQVFWETMNIDSWQAFGSGRAKSLSFKVITCKRPVDPVTHPGGGWITWKHVFTTVLDNTVERAFREKGATYSQFLVLESEIRRQSPPPWIDWPDDDGERMAVLSMPGESERAMQRFLAKGSFESGLLHMHRWFFLQTLRDQPSDPYDHPFGQSVRAVIDASHKLVHAVRDIYATQPVTATAFRPMWTHCYSAGMVLGTFVVSYPQHPDAEEASISLDVCCSLYQATAEHRMHNHQSLAQRATSERRGSCEQLETLGFWTTLPNPYANTTTPPH
ncbi:hypothetical protein BU17DRAFT_72086 [Hysterangium stoloniferum]|nr:hypothetical protein BU17DRAFT_72086 [Hysterangium stoloniferum]